ncbi:MAG: hypothetical protein PVH36_13580 [Desulfobacterales bacterium]
MNRQRTHGEHLPWSPTTDQGKTVDPALCPRMMRLDASSGAAGEARETVGPGGYGDGKL